MPELPEVEHAARMLRRWLLGERIVRAEAAPTRIFRGGDAHEFERALRGRTLEWLERRGKYLLLGFDRDVGLLAHHGMTGKWVRRGPKEAPPAHVRAALRLRGGVSVLYDDPRMFGRIAVDRASGLYDRKEIRGLGPDPLADGVDAGRLYERLHRTHRPVKVALLDQAVVAGLGNIQVTEALFRARLHPALPASGLTRAEVGRLARGIRGSLDYTLSLMGDDEIAYVEEPGAENPFRIYGRAGSPCPRCGHVLETMELGGRASAYCPRCQPI